MPVKIKYVGPLELVEPAALPGQRVKRREVFEVPRDIADSLVATGEYERVQTPKKKEPVAATGPAEAPAASSLPGGAGEDSGAQEKATETASADDGEDKPGRDDS